MISLRGILAVCIGSVFFYLSLHPELFENDPPPYAVRLFIALAGLGLITGGIYSCLHFLKSWHIRRYQKPLDVQVRVMPDDNSEDGGRCAQIRSYSGRWEMYVDIAFARANLDDGQWRKGKAWFDKVEGRPMALEIEGKSMTTLGAGREFSNSRFAGL